MNDYVDIVIIGNDRRSIRSTRRRYTTVLSVLVTVVIHIIVLSHHSIDCFITTSTVQQQLYSQQQHTQRYYFPSYPKTDSRIVLTHTKPSTSTQHYVVYEYETVTSTTSQTTLVTTTTTATTTAAAASTTTTSSSTTNTMISWEDWCIRQLQQQYNEALRIKCPFFRRRASDLLDSLDMMLQFLLIRHKSLPLIDDITSRLPTSSSSSNGISSSSSSSNYIQQSSSFVQSTGMDKLYNVSIEEMIAILIEDWKVSNHKGYYVTGKLSTFIYHDDTIFDGPDPDMPVKGLYKYINAASQLFDTKHTFCELLSIKLEQPEQQQQEQVMNMNSCDESNCHPPTPIIVAKWKMHGRLRLPWKPIVPEWTGTTRYYIHPITGLIYQHIETWDISVIQAFVQTLFPNTITQYIFSEKRQKVNL